MAFGAGLGLGMAYSNCQHDFMNPNYFHGRIVKVRPPFVLYKNGVFILLMNLVS